MIVGRFIDELLQDPSIEKEYKDFLDGIVVIDGSNVARYYFQETDQEYWTFQDFPNVAPPMEKFWIDCTAPEKIVSREKGLTAWKANMPQMWGVTCLGMRLDDPEGLARFRGNLAYANFLSVIDPYLPSAKWGLDLTLDIKQAGQNFEGVWTWRFLVDAQGAIIMNPQGDVVIMVSGPANMPSVSMIEQLSRELGSLDEAKNSMYASCESYMHIALLCISFMHCHNVSLSPVTPPIKRVYNKSAKRRGEKDYQPVPYRVLNIEPMKKVLKGEGAEEKNGASKALHICRGSFATYTQERPLFGKQVGTFWRPMSIKGSKEAGVVTKDYNVKLPSREE